MLSVIIKLTADNAHKYCIMLFGKIFYVNLGESAKPHTFFKKKL